MCLTLKGRIHGSPEGVSSKVAKEDLVVIKQMTRQKKREYLSLYADFLYNSGYHYTNDNFPKTTTKMILTSQGMHSFTPEKYKRRDGFYGIDGGIAVECIIPKGARYYEGTNDDLISDQLIIIGQISKRREAQIRKLQQTF